MTASCTTTPRPGPQGAGPSDSRRAAPSIVRIADLTPDQVRVVRALLDAARSAPDKAA